MDWESQEVSCCSVVCGHAWNLYGDWRWFAYSCHFRCFPVLVLLIFVLNCSWWTDWNCIFFSDSFFCSSRIGVILVQCSPSMWVLHFQIEDWSVELEYTYSYIFICADAVVPITCVIIICLFMLQHYGTHRIGFLFAPIILAWLLCISVIGVYNIFRWNPQIYRALSPYYMFKFLRKTKRGGWESLGGILLCITGSEAMFADLGHFSYSAIQVI